MKRNLILISAVFITASLFAQSPEKLNYQAVVRNSSNQLVIEQEIGLSISILQGTDQTNNVYTEIQTPTTNINGLFSIEIGTGTTSDSFSQIDWSTGPYFISTEVDITGGTSYSDLGTSQLLSVPYALYAKTAENVFSGDYNDLSNPPLQPTKLSEFNNDVGYIATEEQNLSQVLTESNDAGGRQIKNIADPTDEQDVVTKAYIALRVSKIGDTLFLGNNQHLIIPGISSSNSGFNDTITDVDEYKYTYVSIGNQDWLTENLKTTKLNDGSPITLVSDNAAWTNLDSPAYCWYNYAGGDIKKYGPLYNWFVVNTDKICPDGWHVPSETEWTSLIDFCGGPSVAGAKLKESFLIHWDSPNAWTTNETGFTALPGGQRLSGFSYSEGERGNWWSSTVSVLPSRS